MHKRSRGRKFLLQCRYASQLNGEGILATLDTLGFTERIDAETRIWITRLAETIDFHRDEIDLAIEKSLQNWSLSRLNLLSRLILEQAVAEYWFMDTPKPVSIDEALTLAREFEGDDAVRFVNGVLDSLFFPGTDQADPSDGQTT
jgi:N utilization substance protein B